MFQPDARTGLWAADLQGAPVPREDGQSGHQFGSGPPLPRSGCATELSSGGPQKRGGTALWPVADQLAADGSRGSFLLPVQASWQWHVPG